MFTSQNRAYNMPVQSLSCARKLVIHQISFEMLFIRSYSLTHTGMIINDILNDDFDV